MNSFACIGEKCEDACCQNWDVGLDKYHYDKVLTFIKGCPEDEALVRTAIKVNDDGATDKSTFAYIKLKDNGFCPFFNEEGLCHLHSKYGEVALGDVCVFFPRVMSSYGEIVEMTGALSCPEVTRECLLGGDQSDIFEDINPQKIPRIDNIMISRRLFSDGLDFYNDGFLQVRDIMIGIAKNDTYAFETRLYILSNLSHRISQSYHKGCQANEKLLNEELLRVQDQRTLDSLDNYYLNYSTAEPVAIIVIQAVLQLRLQQNSADKLGRLTTEIFSNYRKKIKRQSKQEVYGEHIPPDELWKLYQQNWHKINARFGARLEKYFTRYLTNCLQREWFISIPDPFVYIHLITIRLAVLRFLIASHPDIQSLLEFDDSDEIEKRLDSSVVEIVYLFARGIDHNHTFLNVVYQAIIEQQMMSFDYAMPFIKF